MLWHSQNSIIIKVYFKTKPKSMPSDLCKSSGEEITGSAGRRYPAAHFSRQACGGRGAMSNPSLRTAVSVGESASFPTGHAQVGRSSCPESCLFFHCWWEPGYRKLLGARGWERGSKMKVSFGRGIQTPEGVSLQGGVCEYHHVLHEVAGMD